MDKAAWRNNCGKLKQTTELARPPGRSVLIDRHGTSVREWGTFGNGGGNRLAVPCIRL